MSLLNLAAQSAGLVIRAVVDDEPDLNLPDDLGSDDSGSSPITDEIFSSWALFILLFLLSSALWTSYYLQQRRIKSVHETVLLIFYGMVVGLIIRVSPGHYIQDTVTFNSSYFFNVLLPPIILNSGFELNQRNFFANIGLILVFAIPGTFVSAIVLGTILFIWTSLGLEGVGISFVDAISVGATLSATDPVTILSIFNAYKVDPKLYTIILGESLLNDAISIVMFETAQKFHGKSADLSSVFQGVGLFLMTFSVSLVIGLVAGVLVALVLKHSRIRRYPETETCLILLCAYEAYFLSNGCHMSGIVSLLFFGITLRHYAYHNMSRRTQIATKYIFQLLAQLSENFVFIYLGLALFTEVELVYKPLLIIVTGLSVCIARWCAVFPLSRLVNFMAARRGSGGPEEIPYQYQMMTFWAGLRGAVGVALATGIQGEFRSTLLATVLVVVVLTVIIFGGTTAGMLEILGIRTGVVEANDSDDEFDIEAPPPIARRRPNFASTTASQSPYVDHTDAVRSRHSLQSNVNYDLDDLAARDVDLLADDDGSEIGDIPPLAGSSQQFGDYTTPNDSSTWFHDFDEQVLKPVLLDNNGKN